MHNHYFSNQKKRSGLGFTLIEVMVVIAVIAILAALTYILYANVSNKARSQSLQTDLIKDGVLLERYHNTNNTYPDSVSDAGISTTSDPNYRFSYIPGTSTYCLGIEGYGVSYFLTDTIAKPTDGRCWGPNIAASNSHGCAVSAYQDIYCWGYNDTGQVGDGTTINSLEPKLVSTGGVLSGRVTDVDVGSHFTCAVAGGQAYCWGQNSTFGVLGNNSTATSLVPVPVSTSGVLAGKTVTDIAINSHACALASGQVYCWGPNNSGQLGNGTTSAYSRVPVATVGPLVGQTVTNVSVGSSYACAVAGGQAYCWGLDTNGQLGDGGSSYSSTPVAVNTSGVLNGQTVTAISAGTTHTCAVAGGKAYCWGQNPYGELGNGTTSDSSVPVAVTASGALNGKFVTDISAGGNHTCAIASGQVYCWGLNSYGQLGNNSVTNSSVPVAVSTSGLLSNKTVSSVSAGTSNTCALAANQAFCWGGNSLGQLGNNTTDTSYVPVQVLTGNDHP